MLLRDQRGKAERLSKKRLVPEVGGSTVSSITQKPFLARSPFFRRYKDVGAIRLPAHSPLQPSQDTSPLASGWSLLKTSHHVLRLASVRSPWTQGICMFVLWLACVSHHVETVKWRDLWYKNTRQTQVVYGGKLMGFSIIEIWCAYLFERVLPTGLV